MPCDGGIAGQGVPKWWRERLADGSVMDQSVPCKAEIGHETVLKMTRKSMKADFNFVKRMTRRIARCHR